MSFKTIIKIGFFILSLSILASLSPITAKAADNARQEDRAEKASNQREYREMVKQERLERRANKKQQHAERIAERKDARLEKKEELKKKRVEKMKMQRSILEDDESPEDME